MSTKVTILGHEKEEAEKVLKPIEFCKYLGATNLKLTSKGITSPCDYDNIVLLCKGYDTQKAFDLMLAYSDDGGDELLILGHFNDGVV